MVGDLRVDKNSKKGINNVYAIASSDGFLMLAKRETILW